MTEGQGRRYAAALLTLLLLVAPSCAGSGGGPGRDAATLPPERPAEVPPPPTTAVPAPAVPRAAVGVDPERIRIPSIGVDAPVVDLGLNLDRTLQVPGNYAETGWWSGGAQPGAPGPAVVVGHVDSTTGPAVFHRLGDLRPGDAVEVADPAGQVRRFRVVRLEEHPKDEFPTDAVYGPTGGPELRLVTCSGNFDRRSGHYEDNLIAYATLAA